MKTMKSIILALALMIGGTAVAHDFTVTTNGQKVYFNIKSKKLKTAEVTYNGNAADKKPTYYEGELTIPGTVKHDNVVYTVVGVTAKAFSGADKLTGIIFPMGVKTIGDFAFEGCSSLKKIIFSGNQIKFGQGVFFKCDKIENVSFGSDWKSVDLKMFRWSDSLTAISIPAKMEKIRNLKSLKNLKVVNVDVNNASFSAMDGVLYSKDAKTLYGCPRAYTGKITVADSVRVITPGAFIDCTHITGVELPAGLESMSFREFSRMKNLKEIIFRAEKPIATAMHAGKEVFLLQIATPQVKIKVPKAAHKTYVSALNCVEGEYTEVNGKVPFVVKADEMPNAKNVSKIK